MVLCADTTQNISRRYTDSRKDQIWYALTELPAKRRISVPLECQSDESKELLFRFGQHVFTLYRVLYAEKALEKSDGSAIILPIAMYKGEKPWSAARSTK